MIVREPQCKPKCNLRKIVRLTVEAPGDHHKFDKTGLRTKGVKVVALDGIESFYCPDCGYHYLNNDRWLTAQEKERARILKWIDGQVIGLHVKKRGVYKPDWMRSYYGAKIEAMNEVKSNIEAMNEVKSNIV